MVMKKLWILLFGLLLWPFYGSIIRGIFGIIKVVVVVLGMVTGLFILFEFIDRLMGKKKTKCKKCMFMGINL
jgi:uncharacterized protein with PQ loop repeat